MIREYDFGGVLVERHSGSAISAEVNRLLSQAKRRTVLPGIHDITPATPSSSYASQTLHVYKEGHGAIFGRRKQESVGKGLLIVQTANSILFHVHTAIPTSDELISTVDAHTPIHVLTTGDMEDFLKTGTLRRTLWKIYQFIPGAYPEVLQ